MDTREALHTAARRYCMDHARHWRTQYFALINERTEPPPYGFWPRALLLEAVLVDIESVAPDDFSTLDALRDYLLLAGQTAVSNGTKQYTSVAADSIDRERARFCIYICDLTPSILAEITPLPFSRMIGEKESERLWHALDERWNTNTKFYWYPLKPEPMPSNVIAFQAAWFQFAVPNEMVRGILARKGIKRLWEFDELSPDVEIDLILFDDLFSGGERYWTAGEMDWLIYASHESSITVAGEWLVEAVKAEWPEWEKHLYTGWDYERP